MIYKRREIFGHGNLNILFPKRVKNIKRGHDYTILQRTAYLVVRPSTVGNYAYLFGYAMKLVDDISLDPATKGRRRIIELNLFGRAF